MVIFVQSELPQPNDIPLPPLRQDLEILEGWPQHNGAPTWTLFDPLRNRYFRIGHNAFLMLSNWTAGSVSRLRRTISEQDGGNSLQVSDVGDLISFLLANQLTLEAPINGYRYYVEQEAQSQKSLHQKLLHNYLFFRVPLFRPERLLSLTWPIVAPLFSARTVQIFVVLGLLSLYLVSQQWQSFTGQFVELLSWQGIVIYGVSLALVKILHELGHAWMATKYGLKVPTIGVAFLVLIPILYTDTSNAWRLPSRRKRLMIDGAGIMTELALAVLATLLWVFLPDGPLRAVVFSIAAVSWLFSLTINLNPFMRFDGYYILSDLLGFENMQERGFTLAKWRMREVLFGLGKTKPEVLPMWLERLAILHAWGTWVYRFFLFLGIAFLVYAFFIKIVAVFLFCVEIVWFILMPVFREIKEWWSMRQQVLVSERARGFAVGGSVLLLLAILPLSQKIQVPALMLVANEVTVFPPTSAKIASLNVHNGSVVTKGDVLASFNSGKLHLEIDATRNQLALLQLQAARTGVDAQSLEKRKVLLSQVKAQHETLQQYLRRKDKLILRAPINGTVVDLNNDIHAGRFVRRKQALFVIRNSGGMRISGLVNEQQVSRLSQSNKGVFIPDNVQLETVEIYLKSLGDTAVARMRDVELAQSFGGPIATHRDKQGRHEPIGAFYAAHMLPLEPTVMKNGQTVRGLAVLKGERRSWIGGVFFRIVSVLIRESGF